MTKLQRHMIVKVAAQLGGGHWYRAASSGERATFASLYRAGALQRRAWRGNEGDADAAYEYRLTEVAEEALRQALKQS